MCPAFFRGNTAAAVQHLGEEAFQARILRGCKQRVRLILLHHTSVIHKQHPCGYLARKSHLVGHNDHCHALPGQFANKVQHFAHHLRVQRTGRLVKKHHFRLHGQRAYDGDALLLPAGKLVWIGVRFVRQADTLQQTHGFFIRLCLCLQLQVDGRQRDILFHRQMREQVEMLEYHTHLPADAVEVTVLCGDVLALEPYLSARGLLQPVQAPQKGAFSAARRTDDGDFFALFNGLRHALEHHIPAEGLLQIFNLDHFAPASVPFFSEWLSCLPPAADKWPPQ